MNEYDIAGVLQTYAEQAVKTKDTNNLKRILKELREEIDLRKVKHSSEES